MKQDLSESGEDCLAFGHQNDKDGNCITCKADLVNSHLDPMLQWFRYSHLPEHLQAVSRAYSNLAYYLCGLSSPGPERSVALRKLLESKDAAVRSVVNPLN